MAGGHVLLVILKKTNFHNQCNTKASKPVCNICIHYKLDGLTEMLTAGVWRECHCSVVKNVSWSLIFADDTTVLLPTSKHDDIQGKIEQSLQTTTEIFETLKLKINHTKTHNVIFKTNNRKEYLATRPETITTVNAAEFLGITIYKNLNWQEQISSLQSKLTNSLLFSFRSEE